MNREQVIALAREAGFYDGREDLFWVGSDGLRRFAALVVAQEREACAKVAEDLIAFNMYDPGESCAAAIRARKEET